jgi:hypothetical protein
MEPVIDYKALNIYIVYALIARSCAFYFKAEFIFIFRMRIFYARRTSFISILISAFVLNLLGVRVRYKSSYLPRLNFDS